MTTPKRIAVSALLVAMVAGAGCSQTFGQTAAVVNGHRISVGELNDEIKVVAAQSQSGTASDTTNQALLSLIETELVRQVGDKRHLAPSKTELDDAVVAFRAQNSLQDEATFQTGLKRAGLTLKALRDQLTAQIIQTKLRDQLAPPVSDADVRAVYDQEQAQFQQVMLQVILFSTQSRTDAKARAKADGALAQLRSGADFGALAKKESDDPSTKAAGGKVPTWLSLAQLQAFAAAWTTPVGKPAGPVQTTGGYFVYEVLKKRIQPFSEVASTIRQQLESQGSDRALSDFALKLVGSAHIVVNPRYGDWNAKQGTIVAHQFFRPAPGESPTPSPTPSLDIVPLPS